ncbi:TniB family NTP-binding protein [Deinococcus sp. 14RED07]|uniref:TniB family NTP-binding protein n=1 Tax=Deinococcus sp. 14RED07 TaxID=2745874 RepID=UPI001E4FDD4C|nr:TniB family NTP-binding protein [Deinococcus sp. 14RED07]MCD0175523.1 TniB family NTP-binding protein [Deinococcus sp. 14RED07]
MERRLTSAVQALLAQAGGNEAQQQESQEMRRTYLGEDRYVAYPRAEGYIRRMKALLDAPRVMRPNNLIIVGETNNGKTSVVTSFINRHAAPVDDPEEPAARIPALYVLLRSDTDEDRLYHWILDALMAPYKEKDRNDKKYRMIAELFERLSIRMLVLDEFHHISAATGARQRRCLNTVKTLSSGLQIPIVAMAIPQVFTLLESDPQIDNRFEALALPRWNDLREFRQFLAGLEMDLPLLNASNLSDATLARRIFDLSEGLIGEAIKLIKRVGTEAVGAEERITLEAINALNPVGVAGRNDEARRLLYAHVPGGKDAP